MDVHCKHFRITHRLNTKIIKFVKILNRKIRSDNMNSILETRSIGLEYVSLKRLHVVYENFLKSFPTTLE